MRDAQYVLQTVGDDPLFELMELDENYGWTRRINTLRSIFEPKKSNWPIVVIGVCAIIGLAAITLGIIYGVNYY